MDCACPCTTVASSKAEDLAARATDRREHATTSSSLFFSARTESIGEQIEHSKAHWSQVVEFDCDEGEVAEVSNVDVFKSLQTHPTWGTFFKTFGESEDDYGELVVGEKFAEGGQAELYEAQVKWRDPILCEFARKHGTKYVLKVFRKGTFLRHLQSTWPRGMLQFHAEKVETRGSGTSRYGPRYFCDVVRATLLGDGRFAFLMVRERNDLRSVIDNIMFHKGGVDSGPFAKEVARTIMHEVAKGMDSLHRRNIIHRDLKASNVLVSENYNYIVADFECSIGVIGTGFFRAPEILQACRDGNVNKRPELFTKEADVYSYGMTCYEILTGKLPFEGHLISDYNVVLDGQRPEAPEYVDDWARELLGRCWQPNPAMRPTFPEILKMLNPMEWKGEVMLNRPMEGEIRRKRWAIPSWLRWNLASCPVPCSIQILSCGLCREIHHECELHLPYPDVATDVDVYKD